jgi:hypothetical protein
VAPSKLKFTSSSLRAHSESVCMGRVSY